MVGCEWWRKLKDFQNLFYFQELVDWADLASSDTILSYKEKSSNKLEMTNFVFLMQLENKVFAWVNSNIWSISSICWKVWPTTKESCSSRWCRLQFKIIPQKCITSRPNVWSSYNDYTEQIMADSWGLVIVLFFLFAFIFFVIKMFMDYPGLLNLQCVYSDDSVTAEPLFEVFEMEKFKESIHRNKNQVHSDNHHSSRKPSCDSNRWSFIFKLKTNKNSKINRTFLDFIINSIQYFNFEYS